MAFNHRNPNNWHWVDKDCRPWAKKYFEEKLVGLKAESGDAKVNVSKLVEADGDVDVSNRKGKVICIYDVKISLEYTGSLGVGDEEDSAIKGSIVIPEAAHDTEEDEYQFDVSVFDETKEKAPIKDIIKKELVPQIRNVLQSFTNDLIDFHTKDVQSGSKTNSSDSANASTTKAPNQLSINEVYEFQTTAEELFKAFSDENRVKIWTKTPPRQFDFTKGGKYALFDGNITGEYHEIVENKSIKMSWRLSNWSANESSTLSLIFDQGLSGTNLRAQWFGVPVGQENVVRSNFVQYYVNSLKTTFGFGAIL